MRPLSILLASLLACSPAAAAELLPPVRAVRVNEPIVVDGRLDESIWAQAPVESALVQSDPRQGDAPAQRTEVRIVFDDDAIYVAARLHDTRADSIVARLSRRDNESGSDHFAVGFDTFRDRRTGYYFAVSAAGTQYDGTYMNDDWDDDSWDGVWDAKVRREADGWTAEMRIPFSQMRGQGGDRRVWGVNFERFISRRNETDKLAFTPRGQSGFVSRFPDLVGLDGIRATHRIEVTPYTTGKAEYLVHRPGDPFHDGSRYTPAIGGDLRTSLGSKLMLNASINPDFGQVEIDPAVVNLSDVETYFGEKRPFFTEGTSVFNCGNNGASDYWNFNWPDPTFFYTRRIGRAPGGAPPDSTRYLDAPLATRILGAAKLTGQPLPQFNIGVVSALTQEETADYQLRNGRRGTATIEPLTSYTVLRGIRSFHHERQGLGLMTMETKRALDGTGLADQFNSNGLVVAMDGWTAVDPKKDWVLSGEAAVSRVDGTAARMRDLQTSSQHYFQRPDRGDLGVDPNATSLTGAVARLWLNRQTGPWMSNSAFGVISPGFDANDLGYSSRDDIVNGHIGLGYMWDKPTRFRKYFWVIGAVAEGWNFGGDHTLDQLFLKAQLEQINAWSWTSTNGYSRTSVADRWTRGGPSMKAPGGPWGSFHWDTNSKAKLYYATDLGWNRDEAGSYGFNAAPSVTFKPSGMVSLSFGPTAEWNHEDAHYIHASTDPLATATYGSRYVFARLEQRTVGAELRLDCSLSPALSLQLFAQPLVSSGSYSNYKELARAGSYDFLVYGRDGGSTVDLANDTADPDGAGPAPSLALERPDFTYRTVRGNAVLRWEYAAGSAFYLVWTQDRTGFTNDGRFHLGPSLGDLGRTPANNIVMVKVAHHFEL